MADPNPITTISNQDLHTNKYSVEVLAFNIDRLDIKTILRTQKLTGEFCRNYILNEEYASCVEDTYICVGDVLLKQKHLCLEDIYPKIDYANN